MVSTEDTRSRMETAEMGVQPALRGGCISKSRNLKYRSVDHAYETWSKTAYEELRPWNVQHLLPFQEVQLQWRVWDGRPSLSLVPLQL